MRVSAGRRGRMSSLQNPHEDIAPLFAMTMNAIVLTAGGMIEKGLEKAGDMGKGVMDKAATVAVAAGDKMHMARDSGPSPDAPAVPRSKQGHEVESPGLPEHVKSEAMSVARAEAIKPEVTHLSEGHTPSPIAAVVAQEKSREMLAIG